MEERDIIEFKPQKDFERALDKKPSRDPACKHPSVWLDQEIRQCECRTCGAIIDCYDYLLQLSEREAFLWMNINYLRHLQKDEERKLTEAKVDVARMRGLRSRIKTGKAE